MIGTHKLKHIKRNTAIINSRKNNTQVIKGSTVIILHCMIVLEQYLHNQNNVNSEYSSHKNV